ncbi:AI-2E family transporter [Agromyces kandeliae]|uniref:AI-2E family transporter n=1 Tax=Agromyces kandeliae TaxID=2666141 RepID=A0A6L5R0X4_9MICO|nr:AI-2E family transporter [Agromyces kandeliae]MRX43701.1 AI-2E family transporter [Agromyces kandeliae]
MTDSTEHASPQPVEPVSGRAVPPGPTAEPARRFASLGVRPVSPVRTGFAVTIGVVLAVGLSVALASMSSVLMSITLALFLALGMDPAVRALARRGLSRAWAITIVAVGFLVLVVLAVLVVVPTVIGQVVELVESAPAAIAAIQDSAWFRSLDERTVIDLARALEAAWDSLLSVSTFVAIAGGVAQAGAGVIGAISNSVIVVVLTLYFVAALPAMKHAAAELLPAYRRARFTTLTDEITASVGGVVSGGILLAAINAAVVLALQLAVGSPIAVLLAIGAFLLTLVPLIGSLLFLVVGTIAALFISPTAALVFGIGYLLYIQFEAYWVTPRVMGRAVAVPGVLVIIGAMVGATLFGLLGALVAIPVTASILIVLRRVVIPAQNVRVAPEEGDPDDGRA